MYSRNLLKPSFQHLIAFLRGPHIFYHSLLFIYIKNISLYFTRTPIQSLTEINLLTNKIKKVNELMYKWYYYYVWTLKKLLILRIYHGSVNYELTIFKNYPSPLKIVIHWNCYTLWYTFPFTFVLIYVCHVKKKFKKSVCMY